MMYRICGLNNIRLYSCANGLMYKGTIDHEGYEKANIMLKEIDMPNERYYTCIQCNRRFDGTESFDAVLEHIGKPNEPIIF